MGEYAKFKRTEIKIGTCEDMYYLRADQRHLVKALKGNVNPNSDDRFDIRFRFPFPDEDHIQPGDFEEYDRAVTVPGMAMPEMPGGVDHFQWRRDGKKGKCTGKGDSVQLVQQKILRDGRTVPVLRCSGCGALWRLEDPSEIEAVIQAFLSDGSDFSQTIALRILQGVDTIAVA